MAKFLVIYNSDVTAEDRMKNASQEEMQAGMQAWIDWKDHLPGSISFEFGMPLQGNIHLEGDSEGPVETHVGGYSMIEGDKVDVVGLLKSHPHLKQPDTSIDLYELLSMPGM